MPRKAAPSTPKLRQPKIYGYMQQSSSPAPQLSSSSPLKKSSPATQRKRRAKSPTPQLQVEEEDTESDVAAIKFEKSAVDLTSDSLSSSDQDSQSEKDEELEVDSPRRPTTSRLKRKTRASSEDSEIQLISTRTKGRLRRKLDRSDSEPDEPAVPKKRRLVKGVRPSADDEDDLLEELDKDRIIKSRFRKRDKKTEYQKNLERLKRKKKGQPLSETSSSDEEDESEGTDESNADVKPFAGARPDNESGSQQDEDEFIVEDDDEEKVELPMEFSMNTHQDLTHHFKIVCQLFVHLAVEPAHRREAFMKQATAPTNEYFYAPLLVARRKISGMRDSLVASSTWRSGFKKSLETYPDFEIIRLEMALPMCDACHMGGRISTLLGRVTGEPYDRTTFEPLGESENEDSEDESEDENKLQKEFHLGRFCATRTRVFHQFSHWEHTLYRVLSQEVEELRQKETSSFVKVAFAKGLQPPDNLNDADGIMDWLDQRGIIENEWQRLRNMMERARNLDAASKKGEEDGAEM